MSVQLAYGLAAQALIAASAVRMLLDIAFRPDAASPARGESARRAGNAASARTERRISGLPHGVAWAMMAAPLVLLVPVAGCSIAEHMRGLWGDPSVVTCAILALFVARPDRLPQRPSRAMCTGITALVTVPLYGPVLGLNLPLTDLYAMGWQPYALLVAIALCAALVRMMGRWCDTWTAVLAVALLAYAMRVMESSNLLDYLADPGLLLTIAVLAALPRAHEHPPTAGHTTHD